MHKRDMVAVSSWIGIGLSLWIVAWIIASAIPVFSNLLSLIVRRYHFTLLTLDSANNNPDRPFCQLVHLRPQRYLLALLELGPLLLLASKVHPYYRESHHGRHWRLSGSFP